MEFDPVHDIIGKKYGMLTVEKYSRTKRGKNKRGDGYARHMYVCCCECGKKIELQRQNLITYHTASCGCLKRRIGENNPTWTGYGKISGRVWSFIRGHARERSLPFTISVKDAWNQFELQGGKCALTGVSLVMEQLKRNNYRGRTASLDRIDNLKGYVPGNIHWVHKDVNWMKGRFPLDRFIELCILVADESRRKTC